MVMAPKRGASKFKSRVHHKGNYHYWDRSCMCMRRAMPDTRGVREGGDITTGGVNEVLLPVGPAAPY